jgi:DNA topoisomerase I
MRPRTATGMGRAPAGNCVAVRLRRTDLEEPGITRRRRGKGFSYAGPDGGPVDAATLDRIRSLAIPPAWREVWISQYPNGHIQAVGRDDAGRLQYLYHEAWRLRQDQLKHDRVLTLARRLPRVRGAVEQDLIRPGLGRERVVAAALRMLDYGVFRTGGEEYAEENGTHGVATLLRDHVRLRNGQLVFDFPAKGGLDRLVQLRDDRLAAVVTSLRRVRADSDRLLIYRNGVAWYPVTASHVNERFRELTGGDYTVKDLRTWHATVTAAVAFGTLKPPQTKTARKRAERAAMEQVAEELGNTPTVARQAYVDPRVIQAFAEGRTIAATLRRCGSYDASDPASRQRVEGAVLRLLRS